MSYSAKAHGKLPGFDYHAERPLKAWKKPDILRSMKTWLRLDPPRLELATLALEELKARGKPGRAIRCFQNANLQPIPWLAAARKLALAELPVSTDRRRRGRLYVILRDGYGRKLVAKLNQRESRGRRTVCAGQRADGPIPKV